jgi:hypothetical protein
MEEAPCRGSYIHTIDDRDLPLCTPSCIAIGLSLFLMYNL